MDDREIVNAVSCPHTDQPAMVVANFYLEVCAECYHAAMDELREIDAREGW